jgi:hypothetical protein
VKVTIKLAPNTIIEATGETLQEVFSQVAALTEIFSITSCGLCNAKPVRHVVRENDGFKFFEIHCANPACQARFALGQPKNVKGGLFPRRRDETKKLLPNNGWTRYQPAENGKH